MAWSKVGSIRGPQGDEGPAGQNMAGTFASRPSASSVPSGTIYYCTNVPEMYRSNGFSWLTIGPGGNELGYAEMETMVSTLSTSPVNVTGLTTTFTVGSRPIEIRFDGKITHQRATNAVVIYLVLDGDIMAQATLIPTIGDTWHTSSRRVRVSGLTQGTSHTAKIQIASNTASYNARIAGDSLDPASISVVTL